MSKITHSSFFKKKKNKKKFLQNDALRIISNEIEVV